MPPSCRGGSALVSEYPAWTGAAIVVRCTSAQRTCCGSSARAFMRQGFEMRPVWGAKPSNTYKPTLPRKLWCKLLASDDERMQGFVSIEDLFKGRHFDRQIIVLCVSWYTSFKLSLRDLVIMMADRGAFAIIDRVRTEMLHRVGLDKLLAPVRN